MKKNLALLLCALASAVLATDGMGAAVAVTKPEASLLAHWTFDEPSGTNCADMAVEAAMRRCNIPPLASLARVASMGRR